MSLPFAQIPVTLINGTFVPKVSNSHIEWIEKYSINAY